MYIIDYLQFILHINWVLRRLLLFDFSFIGLPSLFWLGLEYVTVILYAQDCVAFCWKYAIKEAYLIPEKLIQFRAVYVGGDKAGCFERRERPRP